MTELLPWPMPSMCADYWAVLLFCIVLIQILCDRGIPSFSVCTCGRTTLEWLVPRHWLMRFAPTRLCVFVESLYAYAASNRRASLLSCL
jgi:hypothetical protein